MERSPSALPPTTEVVLQFMQRNIDRPLSTVDIAERLHCTPSMVRVALKKLLDAGHVVDQRANGSIVFIAQSRREAVA